MKLLFDNNLSLKLPEIMNSFFPESKHVFELLLAELPDIDVWKFAKANDFSIVTKDKDFYYLSNSLGYPPKIIWLMVGNCRNRVVKELLLKNKAEIDRFLLGKKDILILK